MMTGKWLAAIVMMIFGIGLLAIQASPVPSNKAHVEYKIIDVQSHRDGPHLEQLFNDVAADGWEYVGPVMTWPAADGRPRQQYVAFRRFK